MPYQKGTATGFDDLVTQIIHWTTNEEIHGDEAWELMRSEPWPKGTILKAHGWESGEKQYLGLMPAKLYKGVSYKNWFYTEKVFTEEWVWNQKGLNIKPGIDIGYYRQNPQDPESPLFGYPMNRIAVNINNNPSVTTFALDYQGHVTDSTSYTFLDVPDIVEKSSQAMFLGVFKQYAPDLDFDKQAGGQRPPVQAKPLKYLNSKQINTYTTFTPPVYPGIGFPAIGMDIEGPIGETIDYWLIKDRHRLIIVTFNSGFWDVAYLGFIEPYHKPTEYAFPAAVIGGTTGVIPVGETVAYFNSPLPETGFRFDFSTKNWSLSRGLPTFAASPWNGSWSDESAFSQAQLLLPDGEWKSFANWCIRKEVISVYTGSSYPNYYYGHKEPERVPSLIHYIRPTITNLGRTCHILDDITTYQLEPIEFIQDRIDAKNCFGRLWRMYWPSCPIKNYGEQTIDGKKYLVVPNGWEGRRWHIPHGRTHLMDTEDLMGQDMKNEEFTRHMNCVIRLED